MAIVAQGFAKKGENLPPKSPILLQNKAAKIGIENKKSKIVQDDDRLTSRDHVNEKIGGKIISNVRDFLAFEDSDDENYGPKGA